MPVLGLDLAVPDPPTVTRLVVDLLGGTPVANGDAGWTAARHPGGTTIRWRRTTADRATLDRLTLGVADPERATAVVGAPPDRTFHASDLGATITLVEASVDPPVDDAPGGAAGTRTFDHACFAVASLAAAVDLLRRRLGGEVVFGGHNDEMGTLSSQVTLGGGTMVELLQPTRRDAPLGRFLARRGPGLHHLTWHVHDVEVAARAAVDHGFAVVDTDLDRRTHWRETYLRPSSTTGLLVQLAWTDRHHDTPLDDARVEAILAGRVDSRGYTMVPAVGT